MNLLREERKPIKCVIAGLAIILFIACNNSGKKDSTIDNCNVVASKISKDVKSLIVCDIASVKDFLVIPLSFLLADFEIIQLDDSDEALIGGSGNMAVSDNFIGIFSRSAGGYKVFDKKGKYLYTLSSKGGGPNEYLFSIYDSYIDEEGGYIYLLPMVASSIFVYNLNGNVQKSIPLAYKVHKGKFRVDSRIKEVLLTVLPFPDSPSVVWKQDFEGNIIQEVPTGHLTVRPDYSNEVNASFNTSQVDFSLFHWDPVPDTLYHYHENTNTLNPEFTLKFKDEIIQHGYVELPNHYLVSVTKNFTTTQTLGGTLITADEPSQILIDKKTLRGCFVKFELDMLGGIAEWPWFNRGYYIANKYPHELKEKLAGVLEKSENISDETLEKIQRLHDSINEEDDNNIILIGKLKQDMTEGFKQKEIIYKTTSVSSTPKPKANNTKETTDHSGSKEDDDEKIYGFNDLRLMRSTPYLHRAKEYFMQHNKYKEWNSADEKRVMIGCVVEKNGDKTDLTVRQSCGVEELDNEALRLIREADVSPGTNLEGKPVRADFIIPVFFPPQKP